MGVTDLYYFCAYSGAMNGSPIVTIFVRHSVNCKYEGDRYAKRCDCRKHLEWVQGGVQYRKKAGTRSWEQAEKEKRRLEDQLGGRTPEADPADSAQNIRAAVTAFLLEKEVAGLSKSTREYQYKVELDRLASFLESSGVYTVPGITSILLTAFKATWPKYYKSTYTRAIVQKRLKVFLRFCYDAGWLARIPKLSPVKIEEPPTLPLTETEYTKILEAALEEFTNGSAKRVRALIQLMRWSGLAVLDASCIRKDALIEREEFFAVVTQREKTNTDVYVPIPAEVGREVLAAAGGHPERIFWSKDTKATPKSWASYHGQAISKVFTRAKVFSEGAMISHRLRDTFACDLLQKGVPLEYVSKMLGHTSVVTTERHYAKWIKGRQDLLDQLVLATWKR